MLRRITLGACAACLFASVGWAGETCPACLTCDAACVTHAGAPPAPEAVLTCESPDAITFDAPALKSYVPRSFLQLGAARVAVLADPPPAPIALAWTPGLPLLEDRLSRLPEIDLGLPQSEEDFLTQRRWAHMPAFELIEEPLLPSMLHSYAPVCTGTRLASSTAPIQTQPRYDSQPAPPQPAQQPPMPYPAVVSPYAPAASPYRVATPAYSGVPAPAPASAAPIYTTPGGAEISSLNLPMPSADPVAMVVELFEKLKASEDRGAAARAELANAHRELAEARTARPAHTQATTSTSGEMVVLQIRFFELDLDGVAVAQLDVPGVCREELSQTGLFALAARGGFDACAGDAACQCPHADQCTTCQQCPAAHTAATEPSGALPRVAEKPAADNGRIDALLAQLHKAGLVDYVSRPQVMTQSGQTGKVHIGQEIPFKQVTLTDDGGQAESVGYCNAGIEIAFAPIVQPDGNIQMKLRAERATVDEAALARTGRPTVARQSIETMVEMAAGETSVVAGLIYEQPAASAKRAVEDPYAAQAARYGVPFAGHDRVFKAVYEEAPLAANKRTELVIVITPQIINSTARTTADEKVSR